MATYVYETMGEKPVRFEIQQSMNDKPLIRHPETGEPVRRVISGGLDVMSTSRAAAQPTSGGACCGGGGCGCH